MNLSNYSDVLAQLQAAGLVVETLELGRRQRVRVEGDREKRGWYHLHELPLDAGGSLIVGTFGVWRGTDNGVTKVAIKRRGDALSADQVEALRARMAADRKAADAARRREVDRAADRAQAMWRRLPVDGDSEYLRRKAIGGHGVRYSANGAVVLPLLDVHGRVHGLQAIYPRGHAKAARLGRDKEFWPAGLAKQGHMFPIGSPGTAGLCLLAEGYATAATGFEATGLPAVVAFDAGNLVHVASALRKRWPQLRILVLADDDYLAKCRACGALTTTATQACTHCGQPHQATNAGIAAAQAVALADRTSWLAPRFSVERSLDKKGGTDWNDLHVGEGLHAVRAQLEAHLTALGWRAAAPVAPAASSSGGGGGQALTSIQSVDELMQRYALVYEAASTVFDAAEHKLVPLDSMRNLCTSRQIHRAWMESPDKRIVRLEEVGFDPSEQDANIKCNLWSGWPTRPAAGRCTRLLELGEYLCSNDHNAHATWEWLLKWLAYPIQHPGAKMKTAVIMHGPQGTGKNLFFESVLQIYGAYGQVVDQDTVEDKYNDYLSRKLMLVADEVVARMEMFHAKNKLKVLVTSDWITINPKFVTRYRERNHVNMVFLSNEIQPMALERDDRRYAVIWTPPKWDQAMYNAVLAELRDGGAAALHDHLLHLPLGDFGPATLPPMTGAKKDLIELGLDSSERFFVEWSDGHLPVPKVACRTEDLYQAYRHWATGQGVSKPAQMPTCVGSWSKRPGVSKSRERHWKGHSMTTMTQSVVLCPAGAALPDGRDELSRSINEFNAALADWRKASLQGGLPASRDERVDTRPQRATTAYEEDDSAF